MDVLVIRQLGRPVPLGELYRQLIERGKKFLSSSLARTTSFVFIRKRGPSRRNGSIGRWLNPRLGGS
jgi:hypothetical protein